MEKICKAAFITYNGQVECREVPITELKDNEVLVKVHASLISPGTEMNTPRALRQKPGEDKNFTMQFGYSSAGEIIAVKGDSGGTHIEKWRYRRKAGSSFAAKQSKTHLFRSLYRHRRNLIFGC